MNTPHLVIEVTGALIALRPGASTVGRGAHCDVRLDHDSVSKLHAEVIRRGPYAYVADIGLSRHGTRVNGKLVTQRLLENGDVISFGAARCLAGGLAAEPELPGPAPAALAEPELTRRESDVIAALCKPALSDAAFTGPATARDIAAELVVTEAAVKAHLLRLYSKLAIEAGPDRRARLANEVLARGLVRPLPGTGDDDVVPLAG